MWWLKSRKPQLRIIGPALGAGVTFMLLGTIVGAGAGPASVRESLAYGALCSVAVFAAIRIGARHALLLLWLLMMALWAAFLIDVSAAAGWRFEELAKLIVPFFLSWSLLAAPLAVGTFIFLRPLPPRGMSPRATIAAGGAWFCLLSLFGYFGRFAPDVGSYPRYGAVTLVCSGIASTILPFVISLFCTYAVLRSIKIID